MTKTIIISNVFSLMLKWSSNLEPAIKTCVINMRLHLGIRYNTMYLFGERDTDMYNSINNYLMENSLISHQQHRITQVIVCVSDI